MKEVAQSRIGSSLQEVLDSQGLEDHVLDCFKVRESEEVEEDQFEIESDPQEIVNETVCYTPSRVN